MTQHEFKVGDTGLTRGGKPYTVIAIDTADPSLPVQSDLLGGLWHRTDGRCCVANSPEWDLIPPTEAYVPSATTQALIDLLIARDRAGRAKYGTTLDRTDLTRDEWLQHMVEELLDGAGYAMAAKRTALTPTDGGSNG